MDAVTLSRALEIVGCQVRRTDAKIIGCQVETYTSDRDLWRRQQTEVPSVACFVLLDGWFWGVLAWEYFVIEAQVGVGEGCVGVVNDRWRSGRLMGTVEDYDVEWHRRSTAHYNNGDQSGARRFSVNPDHRLASRSTWSLSKDPSGGDLRRLTTDRVVGVTQIRWLGSDVNMGCVCYWLGCSDGDNNLGEATT